MSDIEYSVITSDVIKSFDCIKNITPPESRQAKNVRVDECGVMILHNNTFYFEISCI